MSLSQRPNGLRWTSWVCTMALGVMLGAAGCGSGPPHLAWEGWMKPWYPSRLPSAHDPPRSYERNRQDEQQLLRQLGFASLVARGTVQRSCRYTGYERLLGRCLVFVPDEVLYRVVPDWPDADREILLHLPSPPGTTDRGAAFAEAYLGQRFVLVLRDEPPAARGWRRPPGWVGSLWMPPDPPPPLDHWVLYPEEPPLVEWLRVLYRSLRQHYG